MELLKLIYSTFALQTHSSSTGADLQYMIYTDSALTYDNVQSSKQDLRKPRYNTVQ